VPAASAASPTTTETPSMAAQAERAAPPTQSERTEPLAKTETTEPPVKKEVVASLATSVTSDAGVSASTPEPTPAISPAQAERNRKQRLREERTLLREAEEHLKEDRLTRPKGENALDLYQKLLESETARAAAQDGLRRLSERLIALGRIDLEAWRLIQPKERNALDRFRSALTVESNNPEAQAGLEEIVDRFLSLAQRFANEPPKAREYLQQAESVLPGLPRIAELRATLFPADANQPAQSPSHAPTKESASEREASKKLEEKP
jgi:hypothetical protein